MTLQDEDEAVDIGDGKLTVPPDQLKLTEAVSRWGILFLKFETSTCVEGIDSAYLFFFLVISNPYLSKIGDA